MEEKLIYVVHATKVRTVTLPWETGVDGWCDKRKNVTELFNNFIRDDDNLIIAVCSTVDKAIKYRDNFIKSYRLYKIEDIHEPNYDLWHKHCYQDQFGNAVAVTITSKYLDSNKIVYAPYNEELE